MKIVAYNTAHAMGVTKNTLQYISNPLRYVYAGSKNFYQQLTFFKKVKADIILLSETDTGSMRTNFINQPERIAQEVGFQEAFYATKYRPHSYLALTPIFRKLGSAILSKQPLLKTKKHYLSVGTKCLVLEAQVAPKITILNLHLPVIKRFRKRQLQELGHVVNSIKGEVIVGGDFNVFSGLSELEPLFKNTKLQLTNSNPKPTFPAWRPSRALDLFLATPKVQVIKSEVLLERSSDHLPIMLEIKI